MWCSDRRKFIAGFAALTAVAGCGFRPVYSEGEAGAGLRGAIRADDPSSRNDFDFVAAFEDLIGRPTAPRFGLSYDITKRQINGGSVQGRGATRVQIFGKLTFQVTDLATGAVRASGEIEQNATYSTTTTQFATHTAREDAELRLMRMLADALVTRLFTEPGLATAGATGA